MLLKIQKKNKMSENNSSQIEIKKKDVIEGLGISIQGDTTPEKIGLLRGQFLKLTNHLHILNGDCYGLLSPDHSYKTFMLKKYFDSNLESFTEIIIYSNFYAIDIHKGSYGNLLQSQDKIFKNIKDNGFKKMNLPIVHRFMNDPRKTVSQDLRTEIWVPIIKKA
jgi:effector-binding domain-containing protein